MKRMSWFFGAVVGGVMALTGCSSEEKSESRTGTSTGNLTVQGSVSSKLGTDNARAVAIGENGKKIWTFLDSKGDFSLKLPTGQAYRVVIANSLPEGGQKIIARLKVKDGATATDVIKAKKGGKVDLGILRRPEVKAPTSGITTKTKDCGCNEDDWGDDGGGWGDDGGDWGDEGGYGEKGGWEDDAGDWGGEAEWGDDYEKGGWDEQAGGWDDGGDFEEGDFDHDDDFGCFDEEGEVFADDDWGGKDGKDGEDGKVFDDVDPLDMCVDGAPVDLVPSKGGYGAFVDLKSKIAKYQGTSCSTFTPKKPVVKKVSSDSSEKTTKGIAADKSDDAVESKKVVGEKCVSKAEVDTDCMCVAGKVVKK